MYRRPFVLTLLLTLAISACQIDVAGIGGFDANEEARRTETHALALAPGETLTLDTSFGDIAVRTGDGMGELHATVRANGRTDEEAAAVLARYHVVVERGANGPVARLAGEPLRVRHGGAEASFSARVDFEAIVPEGTALDAASGSGDVETHGNLGACRIQTGYGTIEVDTARGGLVAKSGSGDVEAKRVEGGRVELVSNYGDVALDAAQAERIECKSGSGDVKLDEASADAIELETSYGNVHARESVGNLRARSGSGDVRLHDVRGAIDAESSYGTVEVDGVLTALHASSGSGNVTARARAGSRLEKSWTLASSYGAVVLRVPEDFTCALDARTSYGDVECEFPLTIEAGKNADEHHLSGTIAGGGGKVELTSSSGDVALRKL